MLGPGNELFDFMACKLHDFMSEHGLGGEDRPALSLGFTFSFPTRQRGLARADLVNWTKVSAFWECQSNHAVYSQGFVCSGVEGQDVVALLEEAIARRGDMNVKVTRDVGIATQASKWWRMSEGLIEEAALSLVVGRCTRINELFCLQGGGKRRKALLLER